MKIMIGFLFISFLLSAYIGAYQPSFTALSSFDSTTLPNMLDDVINHCGKIIESISAYYHDIMASSKIVYFFKYYLPHDQNTGTLVLLGCGFAGLWGYRRKWVKK